MTRNGGRVISPGQLHELTDAPLSPTRIRRGAGRAARPRYRRRASRWPGRAGPSGGGPGVASIGAFSRFPAPLIGRSRSGGTAKGVRAGVRPDGPSRCRRGALSTTPAHVCPLASRYRQSQLPPGPRGENWPGRARSISAFVTSSRRRPDGRRSWRKGSAPEPLVTHLVIMRAADRCGPIPLRRTQDQGSPCRGHRVGLQSPPAGPSPLLHFLAARRCGGIACPC